VLKTVPGFEVLTDTLGRDRIVARGVISSSTGGSSENVLILFNGHRLNEEINGGATFINLTLPMAHVKRVEIIRGPGSALFGANAFLAVINIVTASADDIDGVEVSAGGGSYATQEYYVRAGRRFGRSESRLTLVRTRAGRNYPASQRGRNSSPAANGPHF
jgi:iron complex outermembrane receptor protein